jgi:hypothetical protein
LADLETVDDLWDWLNKEESKWLKY